MKRSRFSAYAVRGLALAMLAVTVVGCCDKEKKQLQLMQDQYNDLAKNNQEIKGQLATARSREGQYINQLDAKDTEITSLKAENRDLKLQLAGAGKPTQSPTPTGQKETTVYTETVGTDVLFEAGKATLTSAGKSKLDGIVSTLKSKYPGLTVRVVGYTDADPIKKTRNLWKDNLDLSANRAMDVTRYLWSKGIPAERIETVGMGSTHFVASNASKSGKASNRRVEIQVVRK